MTTKDANALFTGEVSHLAKAEAAGYGSLFEEAFDGKVASAKAAGYEVLQSSPTTLLLDLDTLHAEAQFERVLPIVAEHFGVVSVQRWKSKSGNTHVCITLTDAHPAFIRFTLQAALGSDGVREALTLVQHRNGINEPSILFVPRESARS